MLGGMKMQPCKQSPVVEPFRQRPAEDLFLRQSRETRLTSYVANLAGWWTLSQWQRQWTRPAHAAREARVAARVERTPRHASG